MPNVLNTETKLNTARQQARIQDENKIYSKQSQQFAVAQIIGSTTAVTSYSYY